ncbi:uncharacterized protein LOC125560615 [Nematostella vectensis]|uniref:uncharacterized protein LOC125560615 n=1 Tax=Nematostella vectensis TaxID=45351 RepID=UPI0020778DC4|nr:uncharacterized protein LOC125560615 [Nematostella vectensis]
MDLSVEEKLYMEHKRVTELVVELKTQGAPSEEFRIPVAKLVEDFFKEEFVKLESFLRHCCGLQVEGDEVRFVHGTTNNASVKQQHQQQQILSRPQFSPFYGFSTNKEKGVSYRVWRFEVESTVRGGLYSTEVISEQIRRSLQGEAKTKLVGLGVDASCEALLETLDQFYSDALTATGDELLAEAYTFKQKEGEEVACFASRLDNHVRLAYVRNTELLPDESAVERQLRMLLWSGLHPEIKDKARHRKDACKSFS